MNATELCKDAILGHSIRAIVCATVDKDGTIQIHWESKDGFFPAAALSVAIQAKMVHQLLSFESKSNGKAK